MGLKEFAGGHKAECKGLKEFAGSPALLDAALACQVLRNPDVRPAGGPAFLSSPVGPVYWHSTVDVAAMEADGQTAKQSPRVKQLQAIAAAVVAQGLAPAATMLPGLNTRPLAGAPATTAATTTTTGSSDSGVPVAPSVVENVLRRFDRNNFGVTDDLMSVVAAAVLPAGALLNHSCAPNCVLSYEWMDASEGRGEGKKTAASGAAAATPAAATRRRLVQTIRTLRPVSAGEELCHSYVEIALPRAVRRAKLQATYGFRCACELCSLPREDPRCSDRFLMTCVCCGGWLPSVHYKEFADASERDDDSRAATAALGGGGRATTASGGATASAGGAAVAWPCGGGPHRLLSVPEVYAAADRAAKAASTAASTASSSGSGGFSARSVPIAPAAAASGSTGAAGPKPVTALSLMPHDAVVSAIQHMGVAAEFATCNTMVSQLARIAGLSMGDASYERWRLATVPTSGGAALTPQDLLEAELEVAAAELALVAFRRHGHPLHLTCLSLANVLQSRYLLLGDILSAAVASEYRTRFYAAAYALCGGHPMHALDLFTLADLLNEAHVAVAAAAPGRGGGGRSGAGAVATPSRWAMLKQLFSLDAASGGVAVDAASGGAVAAAAAAAPAVDAVAAGVAVLAVAPPPPAAAALIDMDLPAMPPAALLPLLGALAADAYKRCATMLSVAYGRSHAMVTLAEERRAALVAEAAHG